MSDLMIPRKIDPGWAMRWTQQSRDLVMRSPTSIGLTFTVFVAILVVTATSAPLLVTITIIFGGWIYVLARALDCHCPSDNDEEVLKRAARMFHSAGRDLAILAVDVILFGLFVWALILCTLTLFSLITKGLLHMLMGYSPHLKDIAAARTPAHHHRVITPWRALPAGIRRWYNNISEAGFLLFVLPDSLIVLYLTMTAGKALTWNVRRILCLIATAKNGRTSLFFLLLALFVFWVDMFAIARPVTAWSAIFWSALKTGAFILIGLWGYLWNREMFEGRKKNAARTTEAHARSGRLAMAANTHQAIVCKSGDTTRPNGLKLSVTGRHNPSGDRYH